MIVGPVLGGIIYGLLGMKWIFFINSISFIGSAISEMFIVYKAEIIIDKKLGVKQFFANFYFLQ